MSLSSPLLKPLLSKPHSLTNLHYALRDNLESLREDYAELCTQVDLIHTDMGLLGKKLDELIHMTCTI